MNFGELFARFVLIFASTDTLTSVSTPTQPSSSSSSAVSTSRVGNNVDDVPFTIYVEGNVGCGKSTFLELFEGDPRIQIVQEPVAEWQNVSGKW